jgi:dihydroorotase
MNAGYIQSLPRTLESGGKKIFSCNLLKIRCAAAVNAATAAAVLMLWFGVCMKADLIIKGGQVIDAWQKLNGVYDVAVQDGKIVGIGNSLDTDAKTIMDAHGCIVSPGLIDNHLHMFADATDAGIDANIALFPSGVTTAVEGGSPGVSNFDLYHREIISKSRVRIKAYLSAASTGMVSRQTLEDFDPTHIERERIKKLFRKYPKDLLGLKIRYSKKFIKGGGSAPLEAVIQLADEIACPITIHATDPAINIEKIAEMLRPGDILCHVYYGHGRTIIGPDNKVRPEIKAARARGIIMDACNGAFNFGFAVAKAAIADGFLPDIISTDYNTIVMFNHPVISLPFLMAKYLALGLTVEQVFAACTAAPALATGLNDFLGTLKEGAPADIAVFRMVEQETSFYDFYGEHVTGKYLIVPQMTMKSGRIVYRAVTFNHETRMKQTLPAFL